jgi:hypothetical protein
MRVSLGFRRKMGIEMWEGREGGTYVAGPVILVCV